MYIDKHITCTPRPKIGDPVIVIGGRFRVRRAGHNHEATWTLAVSGAICGRWNTDKGCA